MNPILFTVTIFTGVILCALKIVNDNRLVLVVGNFAILGNDWWCVLYIIGTWVWYYMQMSLDKIF